MEEAEASLEEVSGADCRQLVHADVAAAAASVPVEDSDDDGGEDDEDAKQASVEEEWETLEMAFKKFLPDKKDTGFLTKKNPPTQQICFS